MNFLSHLYLSGDSEGIIIGNYIADSVKGSDYKYYSPEIQKGIFLHRAIDTFTDSHPIVENSKQRLRGNYRKYSGVITDIFYDHYLAVNWQLYHPNSLTEYTQSIYKLVLNNKDVLPEKSARFTEYMLQYDILKAYATIEGIERVLNGMARRSNFESNMQYATKDLMEHYQAFEEEFKLFFPELKTHSENVLNQLS